MDYEFNQFLDQELGETRSKSRDRNWFNDSTKIALLAFIFSIVSLIITSAGSTILYVMNKSEEKTKRSVTEIDRVYDKDFSVSLSNILKNAYVFIEDNETNKLAPKVRYEKFWAGVADADMLLVSSRLKALDQCLKVRACDREELFSRFPEAVYQAIFFLREFVFLDDDLGKYANAGELEGWWMGIDEYEFLADYCTWAKQKFGVMNLWSIKHEKIRSPGKPLPDACFPKLDSG